MQKAIDTVAGLDINIYNVLIQIADGTYATPVIVNGPWLGSGIVTLQGNTATPANVLINCPGTACIASQNNGAIVVRGMKLVNAAGYGLYAASGGSIGFSSLDFGSAVLQIRLTDGGRVTATGPYTISAGAINHISGVGAGSIFRAQGVTITLAGTPAFSGGFAAAAVLGGVIIDSGAFSGTATGPRYSAASNHVVYTAGGGANYLPGNAAGSISSGGQYI